MHIIRILQLEISPQHTHTPLVKDWNDADLTYLAGTSHNSSQLHSHFAFRISHNVHTTIVFIHIRCCNIQHIWQWAIWCVSIKAVKAANAFMQKHFEILFTGETTEMNEMKTRKSEIFICFYVYFVFGRWFALTHKSTKWFRANFIAYEIDFK